MTNNSSPSSLSPKQKLKRLQSILEDTLDAIQEETGLEVHLNFNLHENDNPDFYTLVCAAELWGAAFQRMEWSSEPIGGSYIWRASDHLSTLSILHTEMTHQRRPTASDQLPTESLVEER